MTIRIRILCSVIAALVLPAGIAAYGQEPGDLFADGNRLYMQEEYTAAVMRYEAALETGYESFELHYNMGNAWFKLGEMGNAILWYERARRLRPDDDDLLSNLELANINIVDRITPIPDVFYVRYWQSFRTVWAPGQWKVIFFAAWFFAAVTLSLLFFLKQSETRRLMKGGLIAAGMLILLAGSVLISYGLSETRDSSGVVMPAEVSAFASPTETGTEVFVIHEGTVVDIRRSLDDWIEIRLADGKVGWIPDGSVEII